jgi:ComF family protein
VWLGDEARELVHHLKYEGYTMLARLMAEHMALAFAPSSSAVLVPVPLSGKRLKQRGFNQAGEIALELGRIWAVPCNSGLLIRTRDTKTQTALTPEERETNVAGAFFASPSTGEATSIILVDDVLTTGSTLAGAASALGEAGWFAVGAVTFARALPFEVRVVQGGRSST